MTAIAILCGLGLVVLGSMAGAGPLAIDLSIRDALHVGGPVPPVLDILNTIGDPLVWDVGVAVAMAALWLRHRRVEATWIGGGVLFSELLATAIKLIVDRPRPPGIVVADWITQASFPSGHATRAAATGVLIVLFWTGGSRSRLLVAIVGGLVAGLMGLARIVAGEHWPTDVLGAYLLVGSLGALATVVPDRLRHSTPDRPPTPSVGTDAAPPPPEAHAG